MIAKYLAPCRYCHKPIKVGRDEYDIEARSSYHVECNGNPKPDADQFAIAARLGYVAMGSAIPFDEWRRWKAKEEPKQKTLSL